MQERESSSPAPSFALLEGRVASIENLIPALYLKGVSTGEMGRTLESILSPKTAGSWSRVRGW